MMDIVEGLRRFDIGEGPEPSAVRLRLRPLVLRAGSCVFEGPGGDMAGGECWDGQSLCGGELMLAMDVQSRWGEDRRSQNGAGRDFESEKLEMVGYVICSIDRFAIDTRECCLVL